MKSAFVLCTPPFITERPLAAGIRRQLGIHTTFNLLGPLSNPAGAPRQIIGVWKSDLVEKMARVLAASGTERAWVVHGEDVAGRNHPGQ